MERRTTPVLGIGASFGIDKTVSSNGRVREKSQRHGFESHTILFDLYTCLYGPRLKHALLWKIAERNGQNGTSVYVSRKEETSETH